MISQNAHNQHNKHWFYAFVYANTLHLHAHLLCHLRTQKFRSFNFSFFFFFIVSLDGVFFLLTIVIGACWWIIRNIFKVRVESTSGKCTRWFIKFYGRHSLNEIELIMQHTIFFRRLFSLVVFQFLDYATFTLEYDRRFIRADTNDNSE